MLRTIETRKPVFLNMDAIDSVLGEDYVAETADSRSLEPVLQIMR